MDRRIDLAIGIAVILAGLGVLYVGHGIRPTGPVVDAIGPRAFPYMIGVFFIVGGTWTVISRLRKWKTETGNIVETDGEPDESDVPASALQAFTVIGASILYVAAMPRLGYPITTPLFVITALKAMRMQSWLTVAVLALVYTAVTYIVFAHYLRVDLPLGPLATTFHQLGLSR
jgi:putative tricarboxylic transport membrane protein